MNIDKKLTGIKHQYRTLQTVSRSNNDCGKIENNHGGDEGAGITGVIQRSTTCL